MARGPSRGERNRRRNRSSFNQGGRRFFSLEHKLEILDLARDTSVRQAARVHAIQPK